MILAPTNRRIIRPGDKPSFEHTQRYGLVKGHWANANRIGLWLFNEGAGKQALDLSGRNTGTLQGTAHFGAGRFGSTLILDGDSDFALTGTVNHNIGTGDFSIVSYVKTNTIASGVRTIWANGTYVPQLCVSASGVFLYWGGWKDSGYDLPSAGVWYHIVLVREAGIFKFYVNGVQTPTTHEITTSLTNATWEFGSSAAAGGEYWDGSIDHLMGYNRALIVSEIAELYWNPFAGIERIAAPVYFVVPEIGENLFRTIDDDVGILDSMGRTQAQIRTITDGIGTVDDMGRTQVQIRTLAEALGLTDTLWKAETRIFADAVGITDAIIKSQGYARTIADDIGLIDSESKLITYIRTLAESLGITDAMLKTVSFPRTISDDVGITDSVMRTVTFARIVTEAMGISDIVTRTQVQLRTIADTMGLTDIMQPGQLVTFAEAMGMTDAMAHTKTQIRIFAEAMGITDDLTRIAAYVFMQADDVGIADAMIRVAVALRTVNDDVGMTDEMSGQIGELVKAAWAFMIIRQTHN